MLQAIDVQSWSKRINTELIFNIENGTEVRLAQTYLSMKHSCVHHVSKMYWEIILLKASFL